MVHQSPSAAAPAPLPDLDPTVAAPVNNFDHQLVLRMFCLLFSEILGPYFLFTLKPTELPCSSTSKTKWFPFKILEIQTQRSGGSRNTWTDSWLCPVWLCVVCSDSGQRPGQVNGSLPRGGQLEDCYHVFYQCCAQQGSWRGTCTRAGPVWSMWRLDSGHSDT